MRAENRLKLLPRLRADLLDRFAALADQNSLLPFALDVNRRADFDQFARLFEAVHEHGDGVRHFLARRQNRLFADEFRGKESLGLVGELILRKVGRSFGQARKPALHDIEAAFAGERRNGENLRKVEGLVVAVDQREKKRLLDKVDLVQQ